jgi:hypothetical protein
MPAIITTAPTAAVSVQREDSRITAETLHRACVSLLTSLLQSSARAASGQYEAVLRTHCVQLLVTPQTTAGAQDSECKRKFALLGALAGACSIASVESSASSVFADIVSYLLSAVEDGLQRAASSTSAGTLR